MPIAKTSAPAIRILMAATTGTTGRAATRPSSLVDPVTTRCMAQRPRSSLLLFSELRQHYLGDCLNRADFGAGEGNRTLVCSLGSCRSAIELRPRWHLD